MKNTFRVMVFSLSLVFSFSVSAASVVGLRKESMRLFPQEKSETVGQLSAGSSITVVQQSGEGSLIEVSQGAQSIKGWVKTSALGTPMVSGTQSEAAETSSVSSNDEKDRFRASVAINPVTIFFPWIELQIGIALNPHFRLNLTPTLMTWAYGDHPFSGSIYGGTVTFTGFFDRWKGWYLEPGFLYMRPSSGGGYWLAGQLIGGYEHSWNSGVFINFGLGAGVGHFDDGNTDDDDWFDFSGTYPYPTWNMFLGYRF